MTRDLRRQSLLQFAPEQRQIILLATEDTLRCRHDSAQGGSAIDIFQGLRGIGRYWVTSFRRNLGARSLKHAQFLEGHLNRRGQLADLTVIDLGSGVHHYKEREQQGDKVGVRNQPTFVIDVFFLAPFAAHTEVSDGLSAGFAFTSAR